MAMAAAAQSVFSLQRINIPILGSAANFFRLRRNSAPTLPLSITVPSDGNTSDPSPTAPPVSNITPPIAVPLFGTLKFAVPSLFTLVKLKYQGVFQQNPVASWGFLVFLVAYCAVVEVMKKSRPSQNVKYLKRAAKLFGVLIISALISLLLPDGISPAFPVVICTAMLAWLFCNLVKKIWYWSNSGSNLTDEEVPAEPSAM